MKTKPGLNNDFVAIGLSSWLILALVAPACASECDLIEHLRVEAKTYFSQIRGRPWLESYPDEEKKSTLNVPEAKCIISTNGGCRSLCASNPDVAECRRVCPDPMATTASHDCDWVIDVDKDITERLYREMLETTARCLQLRDVPPPDPSGPDGGLWITLQDGPDRVVTLNSIKQGRWWHINLNYTVTVPSNPAELTDEANRSSK
jgi:hypothetical protein